MRRLTRLLALVAALLAYSPGTLCFGDVAGSPLPSDEGADRGCVLADDQDPAGIDVLELVVMCSPAVPCTVAHRPHLAPATDFPAGRPPRFESRGPPHRSAV